MNKKTQENKKAGKATKHKKLSTDIVLKYLSQRREPANTKAIAETLGRVGKDGRQETFSILEQLRDQGKVSQLSKHRWAMPHAVQEHEGRVIGHVDGHGYVLSDATKEKISLRAQDMREVLHNDRVRIRVTGRDRRQNLFGEITEVIERGNQTIVGRYFHESGVGFVVPDDQRIGQDILVTPENVKGASQGQVVVVNLSQYPSRHFQPVGEIVEVLGDYLAPGMEIEIALRKHNLPNQWPEKVINQVARIADEVQEVDKKDRVDLRKLPLVTIDGEDARDFDDAVFCERKEKGGFRMIVAIADVSHYVKEGTPLDQEAWQRGTSVYFPSNVIPMLPEKLSNGLCSLKPKVDRLCFACEMQISPQGEILEYDFYAAVMHSHARLTYTMVAQYMETGSSESIEAALRPAIDSLVDVSAILGKKRRETGTVEFEIPEPVIVFSEDRKIEKVVARHRNDAHKLIEECMLAANICAALALDESSLVGIFRVHEDPDEDRISDARAFLRQFKLLLGGGDSPRPKHFSEVINQVTDPLVSKVVQTALLRSMKQARYSTENNGHFALDFDSYTHFTSPIRRYTDLVVHRQLKRLVANLNAEDGSELLDRLELTAEQASMTERRAETATREVTQWLKCEFMSHKVGEELMGTVNTVTDFGLFIELNDFYIEGLVHITGLGQDYYRFDETHRKLIGERSGREFAAGDQLKVRVSRVDMEQLKIDFDLADVIAQERSSRHSKHRGSNDQGGKGRSGSNASNKGGGGKGKGRGSNESTPSNKRGAAAKRSSKGKPKHTKKSGKK